MALCSIVKLSNTRTQFNHILSINIMEDNWVRGICGGDQSFDSEQSCELVCVRDCVDASAVWNSFSWNSWNQGKLLIRRCGSVNVDTEHVYLTVKYYLPVCVFPIREIRSGRKHTTALNPCMVIHTQACTARMPKQTNQFLWQQLQSCSVLTQNSQHWAHGQHTHLFLYPSFSNQYTAEVTSHFQSPVPLTSGPQCSIIVFWNTDT